MGGASRFRKAIVNQRHPELILGIFIPAGLSFDSNPRRKEKQMQFVRKPKLLLPIILILGAFFYLPSIMINVHAATGTVCLIDTSSSSCPTSPASLTGTVGTQLRVSVFLQGSDHINGFDITTVADHTILKPAGVDLTGTILPSPQTIIVHCDGGVLKTGNSCSPPDTADTIHLAAVGASGILSTATTGLLFTAIYNVTSTTSGIPVGFQTGCSGTSVPPNTCVTIANGTPTPVPETIQTARFSTNTTTPDFTITANPTSLTISRGSQGTSTITLTSVGGFTGTVSISDSLSPSLRHPPSTSLSAATVTLAPGGTGSLILTITTNKHTSTGAYTVTISAVSGSISHSITIALTVQ